MLRGVQWVAVLDAALVVRASKCQEFSWNGVRRRENREEGGREKGEDREWRGRIGKKKRQGERGGENKGGWRRKEEEREGGYVREEERDV